MARVFNMSTAWAADPSLIGRWKLDDGSGTIAVDSSSKGANGPLTQLYPGALDISNDATAQFYHLQRAANERRWNCLTDRRMEKLLTGGSQEEVWS